MTLFLFALALTVLTLGVILPAAAEHRHHTQRIARQEYRRHQLKWARRAHPELQRFNYREILQRYNLDDAYQNIPLRREE